jgi:hypothetical protein
MKSDIHWLACVANTIEDLEGEVFSRECLEEMAKGMVGMRSIPVEIEFDYEVGRALQFGVSDGDEYSELQCRMDTCVELLTEGEGLYPVLGFMYEGIIDGEYVNPKIVNIGLTDRPASVGTWTERVDQ